MKKINLVLFILVFCIEICAAQTSNVPTFTNREICLPLNLVLMGYSPTTVYLPDKILPGKLYFRIEKNQLFVSIPYLTYSNSKDTIQEFSINEETLNYYLQDNVLTLEFKKIKGYNANAQCFITLNLHNSDRTRFEEFQKKIPKK